MWLAPIFCVFLEALLFWRGALSCQPQGCSLASCLGHASVPLHGSSARGLARGCLFTRGRWQTWHTLLLPPPTRRRLPGNAEVSGVAISHEELCCF